MARTADTRRISQIIHLPTFRNTPSVRRSTKTQPQVASFPCQSELLLFNKAAVNITALGTALVIAKVVKKVVADVVSKQSTMCSRVPPAQDLHIPSYKDVAETQAHSNVQSSNAQPAKSVVPTGFAPLPDHYHLLQHPVNMSWYQDTAPQSVFDPEIHTLFPRFPKFVGHGKPREMIVGNGKMSLRLLNLGWTEDLLLCNVTYNTKDSCPYPATDKDGSEIICPNNHNLTTEQLHEMFYNRRITHTQACDMVRFSKSPRSRPDVTPLLKPTLPPDYCERSWVMELPHVWRELINGIFEPRIPGHPLSKTHVWASTPLPFDQKLDDFFQEIGNSRDPDYRDLVSAGVPRPKPQIQSASWPSSGDPKDTEVVYPCQKVKGPPAPEPAAF